MLRFTSNYVGIVITYASHPRGNSRRDESAILFISRFLLQCHTLAGAAAVVVVVVSVFILISTVFNPVDAFVNNLTAAASQHERYVD